MEISTSHRLVAGSSAHLDRSAGLWSAEVWRWEYSPNDQDVADQAKLADELDLHQMLIDNDEKFDDSYVEWSAFIWENQLLLALEQSCYQGVLLPTYQRALRLESCPPAILSKLCWFFELCPTHVKHCLALDFSVMLRIDRARRTGTPDWRPETAVVPEQESTFYRPPFVTQRPYGR